MANAVLAPRDRESRRSAPERLLFRAPKFLSPASLPKVVLDEAASGHSDAVISSTFTLTNVNPLSLAIARLGIQKLCVK